MVTIYVYPVFLLSLTNNNNLTGFNGGFFSIFCCLSLSHSLYLCLSVSLSLCLSLSLSLSISISASISRTSLNRPPPNYSPKRHHSISVPNGCPWCLWHSRRVNVRKHFPPPSHSLFIHASCSIIMSRFEQTKNNTLNSPPSRPISAFSIDKLEYRTKGENETFFYQDRETKKDRDRIRRTEKERERQTERQTEKERQSDREIERQSDRESERETETETEKETETETERQRQRETERQRQRETERQKQNNRFLLTVSSQNSHNNFLILFMSLLMNEFLLKFYNFLCCSKSSFR